MKFGDWPKRVLRQEELMYKAENGVNHLVCYLTQIGD